MTADRTGLSVEHLSVRFGGLVAVDDVTLHASSGGITGLIGPNGAGKTTTLNACTGMLRPTAGTVQLGTRLLDGQNPARRAAVGLGRTFQRLELFDSMTVAENVALGPEAAFSSRHAWALMIATRHEREEVSEQARWAMELCGIIDLSGRTAGDLSSGQRRLVELARVVASPFSFLLLDEPSSGLDVGETEAFGDVLGRVVAERDVGILLVEHDMKLVSSVCQYVYVLDFGRLIYEGPTADVLASPVVKEAYLGTVEVA